MRSWVKIASDQCLAHPEQFLGYNTQCLHLSLLFFHWCVFLATTNGGWRVMPGSSGVFCERLELSPRRTKGPEWCELFFLHGPAGSWLCPLRLAVSFVLAGETKISVPWWERWRLGVGKGRFISDVAKLRKQLRMAGAPTVWREQILNPPVTSPSPFPLQLSTQEGTILHAVQVLSFLLPGMFSIFVAKPCACGLMSILYTLFILKLICMTLCQ